MKKENLKEKYEEFHKNANKQTTIVDRNNFTYHSIISMLDKYLQPNMKVLDIGCGIGTIGLYVANKCNEVLGMDISEKAICAAQESSEILELKNASFKAQNFLDADFQDKFNFIICSEVLEHLRDDKLALNKIWKLMMDNSILFLTVPSKNAPVHRIRKYLFGDDTFDRKVGHLRRYSKAELIILLETNGFEVIEVRLTEGVLRNFLFVTSIGNKLLFFANIPIFKQLITLIDNICVRIFGEGQIITVSNLKELK